MEPAFGYTWSPPVSLTIFFNLLTPWQRNRYANRFLRFFRCLRRAGEKTGGPCPGRLSHLWDLPAVSRLTRRAGIVTSLAPMEPFSPQFFILTLALVGLAIIVAALLSGFIDRSDIPQVGVFLALGAMLGPAGLQLLDVSLDSPILRVVATLSLVLVLFTDAVSLSIAEIRRHRLLAFLVIGPGTLLSAVLIAFAAWWLLDFSPPSAALIGAALASTDPVMLRGLLKRPGLPAP